MDKIYYLFIAIIRLIGRFFTSPIVKKLVYYMTARTQTGIAVRLWMAIVMAVCALLFDFLYLQEEFDRLPSYVPVLFDLNGETAEWGDKDMLDWFNEIRLAFFLIMGFIGWVICWVKGGTLMAKRIRLLMVDIANLVVSTGVAMAAIYIEIAKGNGDEKLAEEWEYAVMFFWLVTLIIEYIADKKHIK